MIFPHYCFNEDRCNITAVLVPPSDMISTETSREIGEKTEGRKSERQRQTQIDRRKVNSLYVPLWKSLRARWDQFCFNNAQIQKTRLANACHVLWTSRGKGNISSDTNKYLSACVMSAIIWMEQQWCNCILKKRV